MWWSRLRRGGRTPVDPWEVYEGLQQVDWAARDTSQQAFMALGELRTEVNADGFSSYFFYSYADHAHVALVAALKAGCPELAALVREGCRIAGFETLPLPDCGERQRAMDELDLGVFEDLDATFCHLEDEKDLDAVMRYFLGVG